MWMMLDTRFAVFMNCFDQTPSYSSYWTHNWKQTVIKLVNMYPQICETYSESTVLEQYNLTF